MSGMGRRFLVSHYEHLTHNIGLKADLTLAGMAGFDDLAN